MKLIIGNKSYSSWSLRPWILMRHFNIPFEEVLIKLDFPETTAEIKKYSSAGKVPILIDGDLLVWESIAIMEYLFEKFPEKSLYPRDLRQRSEARSISAEMHSGFSTMRSVMSYFAKKNYKNFDYSSAQGDINRILQIWTECLKKSGGPFLFKEFSIADAMFAPVVGRFKTYNVTLSGVTQKYYQTMLELPAMKQWYKEAAEENFVAITHENEAPKI